MSFLEEASALVANPAEGLAGDLGQAGHDAVLRSWARASGLSNSASSAVTILRAPTSEACGIANRALVVSCGRRAGLTRGERSFGDLPIASSQRLATTIDSDLQCGAYVSHSSVTERTEALDENGDRHALHGVEVDCAALRYGILTGFEHYLARQAANRSRARCDQDSPQS